MVWLYMGELNAFWKGCHYASTFIFFSRNLFANYTFPSFRKEPRGVCNRASRFGFRFDRYFKKLITGHRSVFCSIHLNRLIIDFDWQKTLMIFRNFSTWWQTCIMLLSSVCTVNIRFPYLFYKQYLH